MLARRAGRFLAVGAVFSFSVAALLVFRLTRSNFDSGAYDNDNALTKALPERYTSPVAQFASPESFKSAEHGNFTWAFEVARDQDNYGLTEEQCLSAFPKLFMEIEKSVFFRRNRPITLEEVEALNDRNAIVRALIHKGELYLLGFGDMRHTFSRAKSTLHSLNRALMAYPDRHLLPSVEFIFSTEDFVDKATGPIWAYSKRDEDDQVWLMPDFGYWSWPEVKIGSYKEIRLRIAAVDDGEVTANGEFVPGLRFQDKEKRLIWRGNVATAPEIRENLLKVAHGKSWASVHAIDWNDNDESGVRAHVLPMEEYCRYMFLAHTEGRSYSGRGKYLLNCRSVTFSHKLVWREAHHSALVSSGPEANHVEVERDFSDLERKIEFLLDNPEVAERIAKNAVQTFRDRYLTPAAEACYWRHLIRKYYSVCNFEPRLYTVDGGKKQSRGAHFETWVLTSESLIGR